MRPQVDNPFDTDRLDVYEPFAQRLAYACSTLRSEFYMVLAVKRAGFFPVIVVREHPAGEDERWRYCGPRMEESYGLSSRDWPRVHKACEVARRGQKSRRWPSQLPAYIEPHPNTSNRTDQAYVPIIHQLSYGSVNTGRSAYLLLYRGLNEIEYMPFLIMRQQRLDDRVPRYAYLGPHLELTWAFTERDRIKMTAEVERYRNLTEQEQFVGGYVID